MAEISAITRCHGRSQLAECFVSEFDRQVVRDGTVRLVLAHLHSLAYLGRREDVRRQRNVLVSGPVYDWVGEGDVLRTGDELPLLRNFCVVVVVCSVVMSVLWLSVVL